MNGRDTATAFATPKDQPDRQLDAVVERWSPRRSRRTRRSDIETTVLDITERLLGEVSLHDLEVKQIINEAGTSRTSFYLYFSSKFDVVAALLGRVVDEMHEAVKEWVDDDGRPPQERLRAGLRSAGIVWDRHRNIYAGAAENWQTDPELSRLWCGLQEEWIDIFLEVVERDIALGRAHVKGDVRPLVSALVWGSAHVLYIATSGQSPGLQSVDVAVDALQRMWVSGLYCDDDHVDPPRSAAV